jgi:hypothetical protein
VRGLLRMQARFVAGWLSAPLCWHLHLKHVDASSHLSFT